MDTVEVAPRCRQIARLFRSACKYDRVIFVEQTLGREIGPTDVDVRVELYPFRLHLPHAPLDHLLGELEIRDAVPQQATDAVLLLVDGDRVAGTCQLLCGRHARRTRTDHRDALTGLVRCNLRLDPTLLPGLLDDRQLDVLDRHRCIVDVQRTRGFARGRTDTTGELREIVGRVQHLDRRPPVTLIDQVVPIRDQVVYRAAFMAERNPAIHATRTLLADLLFRQRDRELVVVGDAVGDRRITAVQARNLFEASWFAHFFSSPTRWTSLHPLSLHLPQSSDAVSSAHYPAGLPWPVGQSLRKGAVCSAGTRTPCSGRAFPRHAALLAFCCCSACISVSARR